jgi:glyoxylase I family protein
MSQKNSIIQGAGIHHVAIQTRDWEQSRHFYETLLGMTFLTEVKLPDERFALFDVGNGSYVELFAPNVNTPTPGSAAANDPVTHFALTTSNLHEVLARVRAANYRITIEPFDLKIGAWDTTVAFFEGPNGESIELFQILNP